MADNVKLSDNERLELPVDNFLNNLSVEENMLIRIRDELYESSWDKMRRDLENRIQGRPYIFKLVSRTEHDIQTIEILEKYENKNNVNLGSFKTECNGDKYEKI